MELGTNNAGSNNTNVFLILDYEKKTNISEFV